MYKAQLGFSRRRTTKLWKKVWRVLSPFFQSLVRLCFCRLFVDSGISTYCCGFLLTILFNVEVLDPLSETGSSEASGDVLGDVDIGDPADLSVEPCTGSSRSRNGFLLLFGDVKGLDLPMVANLCSLARSSSLAGWVMNGLVKGLIAAWVSVNKVSFCTPVRPFWEKYVTLMGSCCCCCCEVESTRLVSGDTRGPLVVGGAGVGARGVVRAESSWRLEGWVEAGSSESRSMRFGSEAARLRVSLSPPW